MVDVILVDEVADDLTVDVVDVHVVIAKVVEVVHALTSQFVFRDIELTNSRSLILVDSGRPTGMKAFVPTNVFSMTVVEIFIVVMFVDYVLDFFPPNVFVLVGINSSWRGACRRIIIPESQVDLAATHLGSDGIFDGIKVKV